MIKQLMGLTVVIAAVISQGPEAPAGFDDKSNGAVSDSIHQADREKFDAVEGVTPSA